MPKRNRPVGKIRDQEDASEFQEMLGKARRVAVDITDRCLDTDIDPAIAEKQSVCGTAADIASRFIDELAERGGGGESALMEALKKDISVHIVDRRGDYLADVLGIDDRTECRKCGGKHYGEPHPDHLPVLRTSPKI